ncbi:hypothetical protein JCM8208_002317 [Rhodotorula glutinis]
MSHLYEPTELARLTAEGWPTGDDWADWVGTAEKIEADAVRNPNIAADNRTAIVNKTELHNFISDVLDVWSERLFPLMAEHERHDAIDSLRTYHDILVHWPEHPSLRHQLPSARALLGAHVHDEPLNVLVARGELNASNERRRQAQHARRTGTAPEPGWPSGPSWADYVRTAEIVVNDGLQNDHIGGVAAKNDAFRTWVKEAVEPAYDRQTLFDRLPEPLRRECIASLRNLDASFISYAGGDLYAPSQREFLNDKARSVGLDPVANADANRPLSAYEPRARSRHGSTTPVPQHPHGRQRSRSGTRTPVPSHAHAGSSRQPTLSPDPLDLGDYDPSWQHDPAAPYDRELDDPEFDLDALLDGWTYDH